MGYHKKVGDTVWGSFPSGNTFFHANGLESTFFKSDVWHKEKGGTDEKLFTFLASVRSIINGCISLLLQRVSTSLSNILLPSLPGVCQADDEKYSFTLLLFAPSSGQ